MTPDDATRVQEWRNRPDIARFMCDDRPITREQHEVWIARVLASPAHRNWIVEHNGEPRGVVNLSDIDWRHGHCSWGFYVGEPNVDHARSGDRLHMFDALLCVAEIAFVELQLQKVCSQVLASNERSLALHERLGFVREGVLRAHVHHADGMHDLVLLSMLRSEWEAKHGSGRREAVVR